MLRTFMVVVALMSACSHYERLPCTTPEQCASGFCVNGQCVPAPDIVWYYDLVGDDATGRDEGQVAQEAVEHDDASSIFFDEGLGNGEGEFAQDAGTDDARPVVPSTGEPCEQDSDCVLGSCVDVAEGKKVCSGPCSPSCPEGMLCVAVGVTEDGSVLRECRPIAMGLCTPCRSASDCVAPGAQCLPMLGGDYCTVDCSKVACPTGFVCLAVAIGIPPQCVPVLGTCACPRAYEGCGLGGKCEPGYRCVTLGQDLETVLAKGCKPEIGTCWCVPYIFGEAFPCEASNGFGTCVGKTRCTLSKGFDICDAPLPQAEICDWLDNDCDGETDEDFVFVDWDGTPRLPGERCGTGVCSGGEVVCVSETSVGCTTEWLKTKEVCKDGKDNDCDGKTDEGCWPEDLDGDGWANEEDCDPYDSAKHPGAKEPCCPRNVPEALKIQVCDMDCDGSVSDCEEGDADGDGFVAMEFGRTDCNDSDPTIYPLAPERCGDGVDQDCDGFDLSCDIVIDGDQDNWPLGLDCNDDDPAIHPWAEEVCDDIDNDCDGVIDEGNPGGGEACGLNIGQCSQGTLVCVHNLPFPAKLECVGSIEPQPERCDGFDNDCDGLTDEDFPEKGKPCDGPDIDQCKNGIWVCAKDGQGLECGLESVHDILEICGDGLDNDCDGIVDNGCLPLDIDGDGYLPPDDCDDTRAEVHPGAKEPCCNVQLPSEVAKAVCDFNCDGLITFCDPNDRDFDGFVALKDGGTDCDDNEPTVFPGAPERCGDGIDQDCDGKDISCSDVTDKDGDGYFPPFDCNDSNPNIHPWAKELCNNKDDDCDGVIDNGNPEGGGSCGTSIGECEPGTLVCTHFPFQARLECIVQKGPSEEICDGKDNNCNGLTDEYWEGLGTRCDGPDEDLCKNGFVVCSADGKGVICLETITNIKEMCDGKDNDCDGLTDEDFSFEGTGLGGPCKGFGECGPGVVVCSKDKLRATCSTMPDGPDSEAMPEICDGLDNDCDGLVDNGLTYFGQPVGAVCLGIGACGPGIVECNPITKLPICSSNPDGSNPKARPEVCNGLDDDCDGHTDEGLVPGPGDCKDLGVCAGQNIPAKCRKGKWECDYSQIPGYQPEETWCDGLDNDCDGLTDEGFPVGLPCDGPDSDLCKNGTWTCTSDKTGWECVNETITDIKEVCNGIDDDCDGATDEDFAYFGIPVGGVCDGIGECGLGIVECLASGEAATCSTNPDGSQPQDLPEVCDGLDNDCDGMTDEDWPVGLPCDGADEDRCEKGTWTCTVDGSGVECVNETETNIVEVCNGLDDDCDGLTDEDFFYGDLALGEPCKGIGECGVGIVVCSIFGLSATCSTNPDGTNSQASAEVCDGLDNDCDGATDEGMEYEGTPLGGTCVAKGECGPGIVVCSPVDKVATCSTAPNGTEPKAQEEVCDLKDNDCDGITDNVEVPDKSSCLHSGVCASDFVDAFCIGGQWFCSYERVPGYEEFEVSCDGLDNDCDGQTDELWMVGLPCDGPDEDLCANGVWICSADKSGVECGQETIMNIKEVCNGLDDDCDGLTDEEGATGCVLYFYDGDGDGHGVEGQSRCLCWPGQEPGFTALRADDCDDANPFVYPGRGELCNDQDDDCDGLVDEDFPQKGLYCDGPDEDLCENGTWSCKADGAGLECANDNNTPEMCDGRDNDCDGLVDEDWPVGQPCDGPDSDFCKNGSWTCAPSGLGVECVNETVTNIVELCNNIDDDCDGVTDEDWPQKGHACVSGVGECQRSGIYVCSAEGTQLICNATPGQPSAEVCDNKDNDCDGLTDEDWADLKGRKCDTNPNPPPGIPACSLGVWQCKPDKTGIYCVGDVDCVQGSQCLSSGSDYLPDSCLCGSDVQCTADLASQCSSGQCLCGSGPKCTAPKRCIGGVCQ